MVVGQLFEVEGCPIWSLEEYFWVFQPNSRGFCLFQLRGAQAHFPQSFGLNVSLSYSKTEGFFAPVFSSREFWKKGLVVRGKSKTLSVLWKSRPYDGFLSIHTTCACTGDWCRRSKASYCARPCSFDSTNQINVCYRKFLRMPHRREKGFFSERSSLRLTLRASLAHLTPSTAPRYWFNTLDPTLHAPLVPRLIVNIRLSKKDIGPTTYVISKWK